MGGSCQSINDFLPRVSNGAIEVIERIRICSQQLVCQSKYLLNIFKANVPFEQFSSMFYQIIILNDFKLIERSISVSAQLIHSTVTKL